MPDDLTTAERVATAAGCLVVVGLVLLVVYALGLAVMVG